MRVRFVYLVISSHTFFADEFAGDERRRDPRVYPEHRRTQVSSWAGDWAGAYAPACNVAVAAVVRGRAAVRPLIAGTGEDSAWASKGEGGCSAKIALSAQLRFVVESEVFVAMHTPVPTPVCAILPCLCP